MLALLFRISRGRVGWATSSTPTLAGVVEPAASSAAGTTRSASEEVPEVLLVEQTLLLRPRDRMCDWGKLVSSMASFSSLALISDSWRVKLMLYCLYCQLSNIQIYTHNKHFLESEIRTHKEKNLRRSKLCAVCVLKCLRQLAWYGDSAMLIRTSSRALSFGALACCSAFAHSAQVYSLSSSSSAAQTVSLRVLTFELVARCCGGRWTVVGGGGCSMVCGVKCPVFKYCMNAFKRASELFTVKMSTIFWVHYMLYMKTLTINKDRVYYFALLYSFTSKCVQYKMSTVLLGA